MKRQELTHYFGSEVEIVVNFPSNQGDTLLFGMFYDGKTPNSVTLKHFNYSIELKIDMIKNIRIIKV